MTIPTNEDCERIHKQYGALTGIDIQWTMQIRFTWEAWLARGWTESDLACAVRYIKNRIRERRMEKESLLLRNLISRIDNFAETLAMARATARNEPTHTPRSDVLRRSGRSDVVDKPAKAVGDILRAERAFQAFKDAMKDEGLA